MRVPHYLTRTPAGYSFRCRVPADLQACLGCKVIKRSLRTTCRRIAQGEAFLLASRYARAFEQLRTRDGMSDQDEWLPSLKELTEKMREALAEARAQTRSPARGYRQVTGDLNLLDLKLGIGAHGPFMETEPDDSPEVIALAMKKVDAWIAASQPSSATATPAAPGVSAHITAKEAQTRFLASIKPATKPKTYSIKKAAVEGFVEHYTKQDPKRLISGATRPDVADWVAFLRNAELSTPTIVNKLSYLRGFFAFLIGAGFYPPGDNPAMGQAKYSINEKRLRRKRGFRPLTLNEVQALFSPLEMEKLNPEARWGVLIGLYTGARVAEVGQLAVSDFINEGGVDAFNFTDEGPGQSIKTDASKRKVPIHPDLIRLGILDRRDALAEAQDVRFFPNVQMDGVNGAGNWLSKVFGRHLRAHGIISEEEGPKVGFHSLRKTVIQTLQGSGAVSEMRAQLVGHELDDEHHGTYSREFTLTEKLNGASWEQKANTHRTTGLSVLDFGLDLDGIKRTLGNPQRRRRKA